MRLSRPCWDKPHRCPGWAGAGWKFPKKDFCGGGYITFGMTKEQYALLTDEKYPRWYHLGQCTQCDVAVLPYWTRKLDPRYHWGMRDLYWRRAEGKVTDMFNWIREWWITWRVWRHADAVQWEILTRKGHDPDDFVEAERPE